MRLFVSYNVNEYYNIKKYCKTDIKLDNCPWFSSGLRFMGL